MAEIFGRYSLLKHLASGGMAEIWLALQTGTAGTIKPLVIKRILPHLTENQDFVDMFLNEARIASGLNHQNIAQIYDVGEVEGRFYIAMEYVHGVDLRTLYKKLGELKRPLPIDVAIYIVSSICAGLHHAHEKRDLSGRPIGIVHRDVSPQNVLLDFDGGVKLIDFGIAKATNRLGETRNGVIKGKTAYLSPEQARGQSLDARSDVFATGVIFYEMTVGRRPFEAENDYGIVLQIADCEFDAPRVVRPGYPDTLERVVLQSMAAKPDDRHSSARAFQEALQEWGYQNRLRVGAMPLARLLHEVFPKRAETDIAAQLAAAGTTIAHVPTGTPSAPSMRAISDHTGDHTPGAISRTGTSARGRKSRAGWWAVSVAAIVLGGVGGGMFYTYTNPGDDVIEEDDRRPVAASLEDDEKRTDDDDDDGASASTDDDDDGEKGKGKGKDKGDDDDDDEVAGTGDDGTETTPAIDEVVLVPVKFVSEPIGAEVWLEDGEKPLGITPFETELAKDTDSRRIEFRRKGYVPYHAEVVILGERIVTGRLVALATAAPAVRVIRTPVKKGGGGKKPPPGTSAPATAKPKDTPSGRIVDPFK